MVCLERLLFEVVSLHNDDGKRICTVFKLTYFCV